MKYVLVLEVDIKETGSGVYPDAVEVRHHTRYALSKALDDDRHVDWKVTGVESLRSALGEVIL